MIRSRARTGTADAPCFQRVISLFSLCYCFLEKLSKSLIPLSDCPFVLNRLPVFLGKSPCFREKTGTMGSIGLLSRQGEAAIAKRIEAGRCPLECLFIISSAGWPSSNASLRHRPDRALAEVANEADLRERLEPFR